MFFFVSLACLVPEDQKRALDSLEKELWALVSRLVGATMSTGRAASALTISSPALVFEVEFYYESGLVTLKLFDIQNARMS